MQSQDEEQQVKDWREVAEQVVSAVRGVQSSSNVTRDTASSASIIEAALKNVGQSVVTNLDTGSSSRSAVNLASSLLPGLAPAGGSQGGVLDWLTNLNPVLGLMRLFRRSEKPELPELPRFSLPARQNVLAGISGENGWTFRGVDYGAGWSARQLGEEGRTTPPVTIQVQALDTRSFLDHRDEIAAAVRQALLESHSLGDILNER